MSIPSSDNASLGLWRRCQDVVERGRTQIWNEAQNIRQKWLWLAPNSSCAAFTSGERTSAQSLERDEQMILLRSMFRLLLMQRARIDMYTEMLSGAPQLTGSTALLDPLAHCPISALASYRCGAFTTGDVLPYPPCCCCCTCCGGDCVDPSPLGGGLQHMHLAAPHILQRESSDSYTPAHPHSDMAVVLHYIWALQKWVPLHDIYCSYSLVRQRVPVVGSHSLTM